MESLPNKVIFKNEAYEICEVGHEIKVGDLLAAFTAFGKSAYPFVKIGKKYAIVRYNDVATKRCPLFYEIGYKPNGTGATTNEYRIYRKVKP